MPIPKSALQEALKPLPTRIYEFLARNNQQAYSLYELISNIEKIRPRDQSDMAITTLAYYSTYNEALRQLVSTGKITKASVGGTIYYGIRE